MYAVCSERRFQFLNVVQQFNQLEVTKTEKSKVLFLASNYWRVIKNF